MIVPHYPKTPQEEQCQREAVQFAFGFLAPVDRLVVEWERTNGDPKTLREIFRMPSELIEALYESRSLSLLLRGEGLLSLLKPCARGDFVVLP